MTEMEKHVLQLMDLADVKTILLVTPSRELLSALKYAGVECTVFSFDEMEALCSGEKSLRGEFSYMLLGDLLDRVSDSVALLEELRRVLSFDGTIFGEYRQLSEQKLMEVVNEARFHSISFEEVGNSTFFRIGLLTQKTILLRKKYTPVVRHELLYLLRRMETGIAIEENRQALYALCGQNEIEAEYLLSFIENTMLEPEKVVRLLTVDGEMK